MSVQIPGKAGDELTFKALQTYSDGDVVRWIGAPDSEQPAPQVKVTAAAEDGHAAAKAEQTDDAGRTPMTTTRTAWRSPRWCSAGSRC